MLKIGIIDHVLSHAMAMEAVKVLHAAGIGVSLEPVVNFREKHGGEMDIRQYDGISDSPLKLLDAALLRGDVSAVLLPQSWNSVVNNDASVVNAALIPAGPRGLSLLVRKAAMDPDRTWSLKEGSVVRVCRKLDALQLLSIRPDLRIQMVASSLQMFEKQEDDAVMLVLAAEAHQWCVLDPDWEAIDLHPREIVPPPGSGLLVFRTLADDIVTRRMVSRVHHDQQGVISNIERSVQQMLSQKMACQTAVYAETDPYLQYHVRAAVCIPDQERLVSAHYSSSTTYELAETAVQLLMTQI